MVLFFIFEDHRHLLEVVLWMTAMFSLTAFLWFGGFDVLRHYTLRCVLTAVEGFPLRIATFLDHAARLDLLHRIGGGYIFPNRLLMDHFAAGEFDVEVEAN